MVTTVIPSIIPDSCDTIVRAAKGFAEGALSEEKFRRAVAVSLYNVATEAYGRASYDCAHNETNHTLAGDLKDTITACVGKPFVGR